MDSTTECTEDGITLKLSGTVTIAEAGELKKIMLRDIPPGSKVTVDLSKIDECDLSLFQLLCAGHKRSLKTSGSMRIGNYSGEVYETMKSTGILRSSGCMENSNENCLWIQRGKGELPL